MSNYETLIAQSDACIERAREWITMAESCRPHSKEEAEQYWTIANRLIRFASKNVERARALKVAEA